MEFWSRERILRGVLSPLRAGALWAAAAVLLGSARSFAASSRTSASLRPGFAAELAWGAAAAGFLAVAAYVDAALQILPDPLVASAAAAAALSAASRGIDDLLAAAAVGALFFLTAFALTSATSLGRGDAKLTGALGLWTGQLQPMLLGLAVGAVCAGIVACALLVVGKIDRRTTMALGPWLVAGASAVWAGSG